jgi:hypothetical protein
MNAPVDVSFFPRAAKPLTSYRPYWARRFGTAPFLPMSRAEMDQLGWDSCDVILVTGDAYVDHPSFGMAVIGRVLEAQGFRVGIIAQPDWQSSEPFKALGRPNLFWGVTAGNMDSMINRYTADRKIRSDDAYTPGDVGGKRPDRAAIVYSQRCREAYKGVPIVLGGIEGSLRRIAHYDYWSDKVRRSIVVDSKCDILLYGNAERALVEVAHRIARREPVDSITDVRGTAFVRRAPAPDWFEVDSTTVDEPGRVEPPINPYLSTSEQAAAQGQSCALPGLHCTDRSVGPLAARICPRGVRCLPALRRARARLPAGGVRALPCREAGGLLLQEARVLPELRRATHGRECAAPGRGGVRPAACAAMGAELSVPLAFPVRQQARSHWPGAGHRAARDRRLVGRSSRHRPRQRPVRRGDADPALRQRAEPECSLPHAVARRRVRRERRAPAAQAAPAPRPCPHLCATDAARQHHRASRLPAPDAQRLAGRRRRIRVPVRQRG